MNPKSQIMDDYKQRLFRLGEQRWAALRSRKKHRSKGALCNSLSDSCEAFGVEQGRLENIAQAMADVVTLSESTQGTPQEEMPRRNVDYESFQRSIDQT